MFPIANRPGLSIVSQFCLLLKSLKDGRESEQQSQADEDEGDGERLPQIVLLVLPHGVHQNPANQPENDANANLSG